MTVPTRVVLCPSLLPGLWGPPTQDADCCGCNIPPLPPNCLLDLLSLKVHGNVGKETRAWRTVLISLEGSPRVAEKGLTFLAGEGRSKTLNGIVNPAPLVLKLVEIPSVSPLMLAMIDSIDHVSTNSTLGF